METLIFVLGTLSGLLLIAMVYTFVGVLKMQKEVKNLTITIDYLQRDNHELENRMWSQFEKIEREVQNTTQCLSTDFREINQDLQRYVDSRFDKTIDAMSSKIDAAVENNKKVK